MKLFFREQGEGPGLIILHGLYGSSDNWLSIARKLSEQYHVYLVDQRNHGRSPHDPVHDFRALCNDLDEFIHDRNLEKAILLGHSMGGKTAMFYAACHPEEVQALIVVDISPRTYRLEGDSGTSFLLHKQMMEAMLQLDLQDITSRTEVLEKLKPSIPSERVRHFLLKNLIRKDDNSFAWKINLPVLYDQLPNILQGLDSDPQYRDKQFTSFPVLFIRGEDSGYITAEDLPAIRKYFPFAETITIPDAGHWLHAEQPEKFIRAVLDFLEG